MRVISLMLIVLLELFAIINYNKVYGVFLRYTVWTLVNDDYEHMPEYQVEKLNNGGYSVKIGNVELIYFYAYYLIHKISSHVDRRDEFILW